MVIVKADLHIHTSDDIYDTYIKHSSIDLINEASKKGINVISITLHNHLIATKAFEKYKAYAKKKGILLINGVELKIEGKHVLIYNITKDEFSKLKSFNDLRTLKKKNKNVFVIAPHPFMPKNFLTKTCLQDKYFENKDLFDALEIQQFYFCLLNPNKKTIRIAKNDNKAIVANSDSHFLKFFGDNYTLVDVKSKLDEKSFFMSIKKQKTQIVIKNNLFKFINMLLSFIFKF
ncbi:MAG: PHP-associated domain-containing protein [Candidatus Woesearchaeota archaeon]|jgi:hypothetical protein